MVFAPQLQHLPSYFRRCLVGRIFWNGFGIDQPSFTILFIDPLPSLEAGPANAKIAATLRYLPSVFSVL
jgi:hypothetical protein